jgi:hypothetical protein
MVYASSTPSLNAAAAFSTRQRKVFFSRINHFPITSQNVMAEITTGITTSHIIKSNIVFRPEKPHHEPDEASQYEQHDEDFRRSNE